MPSWLERLAEETRRELSKKNPETLKKLGELIMAAVDDLTTAVTALEALATQVVTALGNPGNADDGAVEALATRVDTVNSDLQAALPATGGSTTPPAA